MREAFRNLRRRKARSFLTIFGVAIGVFALTTMGALALYFNRSLNTSLDYFSSRVTVTAKGVSVGSGPFGAIGPQVPASLAVQIKAMDGVQSAYPTLILPASDSTDISFKEPEVMYGFHPSDAVRDPKHLDVAQGRELTESDRGKVVLGASIVASTKAHVGDTIKLRGRSFEVVGIYDRTNGALDSYYFLHIDDVSPFAQRLNRFSITPQDLVTNIVVIPKPGVSGDALAKRISDRIPGVAATPPETLRKQIKQGFQVFNLIILGSALVAMIVGGLSVINTMVVSISERRKEFGIKRVVGAKARHIIGEVVAESALIALIGGLLGCLLGWLLTHFINAATSDSGLTVFLFNGQLVLVSLGFAVILGILAGLYPAWRAIRIKPVNVLREE